VPDMNLNTGRDHNGDTTVAGRDASVNRPTITIVNNNNMLVVLFIVLILLAVILGVAYVVIKGTTTQSHNVTSTPSATSEATATILEAGNPSMQPVDLLDEQSKSIPTSRPETGPSDEVLTVTVTVISGLYPEPVAIQGTELGNADVGEEVTVLGRGIYTDWLYVKIMNGCIGYMSASQTTWPDLNQDFETLEESTKNTSSLPENADCWHVTLNESDNGDPTTGPDINQNTNNSVIQPTKALSIEGLYHLPETHMCDGPNHTVSVTVQVMGGNGTYQISLDGFSLSKTLVGQPDVVHSHTFTVKHDNNGGYIVTARVVSGGTVKTSDVYIDPTGWC